MKLKNTASVTINSSTGTVTGNTPAPTSPQDPNNPPTPGSNVPPVVHFAYFNVNKIAAGGVLILAGIIAVVAMRRRKTEEAK